MYFFSRNTLQVSLISLHLALVSIGVKANETIYENLVYKVDFPSVGQATLIRPNSKNIESLDIPQTLNINGLLYSVTNINDYAFADLELKTISIPPTIKKIGRFSFYKNNISVLVLNEGLEEIGNFAFFGNQINEISFPETLRNLGDFSFANNVITDVLIPLRLKEISDGSFASNRIKSVELNSTQIIGDFAFNDNEIEYINFPNFI